ncbi:MAG: 50S ribosomal protein L4 [archaeon]
MKANILSLDGKKKSSVELPSWFNKKIREDICQKYFEATKQIQPYGPNALAGMKYSASGKLKHRRHKWKTTYGHGISRIPRKILWRRGDHFYWVGATVASTRGGRKAHAPKPEHFKMQKKINKKEIEIAIQSALSSTGFQDHLIKRYGSIEEIKIELPLIVESSLLNLKSKEFFGVLRSILGSLNDLTIQKKKVRSGRGKLRGRKYKKNAGLLLIIGSKEQKKLSGIDIKKISDLEISDLWPLGRLTIYTEKAIEELKGVKEK